MDKYFRMTASGPQPFTQAEEDAEDARLAAIAAAAQKVAAQAEIDRLESLQTSRLLREASLNLPAMNGDPASPYHGPTAAQTLAQIEAQIESQRAIIRGA